MGFRSSLRRSGGSGSTVTSRPVSLFPCGSHMNLNVSHRKPTWTEGAKEGSQGVYFARNQLVTDFLLVLCGAEQALGENAGLVFPWKTSSRRSSGPCLELVH